MDVGDWRAALSAWRAALELLPSGSRQHEVVAAKVAELAEKVGSEPEVEVSKKLPVTVHEAEPVAEADNKFGLAKGAAGMGTLALLFWKFKFVLAFVITKGKLLLAGLTKGSTFFSMLLSLGVYWAAWGWKFALGIVLSLYVHEMGHVAALRHYGIKATAPMFVPGLGAFVRLKQAPANAHENARVGLAGPVWGLGAAIAAYLVYLTTGWTSWAAIAHVGAWINLFNLFPVWQLDGGRGFASMTRKQRWLALVAIGITWFLTHEGMLVLLLLGAVGQALGPSTAKKPDHAGLVLYVFLVGILSWMCMIEVPM